MQAFLKKVFRKDIVAIIQNILGVVQNFWAHHISPPIMRPIYSLNTWWRTTLIWLQQVVRELTEKQKTSSDQLKEKVDTAVLGNQLNIPLIIYQPGKVGSITVNQSLKVAFDKLGIKTPIYHAHNLNNISVVEASIKQARKNPGPTLKKLQDSRELRHQIDSNPFKKWNIISLVRDPVALRVSTLFQVLDEYIPDWAELIKAEKLTIKDLQRQLMTRKEFDPIHLSGWYNKQVKDLFGFDVFASPFDVEKGYTIYRSPLSRFSFMIIRLEDLNRVASDAFYNFIRLEKLQIVNQNVGSDKHYSELYKKFKTVPLPVEYLDAAYATPYARHFYTAEEIEAFRNKWLHPET